jgi:RNA polymerase sigma factor (sigma-70 family)
MDESDLILKAQVGDEAALAKLFKSHGPAIRGVALKILKDEAGVDEALQIIRIKVWRKIRTFDPHKGAKLSTWLHTITKNTCLDVLREQKRRPEGGEEQESEGGGEWVRPTGKNGWIEYDDDPKNLLIAAEDEREQAKKVEEARKTKEQRKSWLYDQGRDRILRHIRPEFFKAIQSKWHIRPDKDFLKGVLIKGLSPDPEEELGVLRGAPEKVALHDKHVLLPPNKPGERITDKPSVQFCLDPHYFYRRTCCELPMMEGTGNIDGKPHRLKRAFPEEIGERKSEFDLIRIKILAPGSPQDAKRFLDKAKRDLSRLGFDDRFMKSYLKNAELQFEKYLRPMATRIAGEILDEFCRILGEIRGDHLWRILVTDPETGVKDEVARTDLEAIISSRKTPRASIAISHKAKGSIIAKFLDADKDEEKRIFERIMSRRRRGK